MRKKFRFLTVLAVCVMVLSCFSVTAFAYADDTEDLPVQLDPGELGPVPFALVHGRVGERDVPGQGKDHGAGVLCRGQDVRGGGVHDEDTLLGGIGDVDVVHTDPCTSDDAKLLGRVDDLPGHLGA